VEPLRKSLPQQLRLLVTTTTDQGLQLLQALENSPGPTIIARYQPWDHPALVGRFLEAASPRVVVLLETELWPGILMACARRHIPVVVASARMTRRSLARYLMVAPWLRSFAPRIVAAVSPHDAARFRLLFPSAQIEVMPSLKFALTQTSVDIPTPTFAPLLTGRHPVIVLGSIRREEETAVLSIISRIRHAAPNCAILLFPRHLHRIPAWSQRLSAAHIPFCLRSQNTPPPPGGVLLADGFGELWGAYSLAHRAFVGGTVVGGGHNFLEPLAFGIQPCIGPHWEHFTWVGADVVQRLVRVGLTPEELANILLSPAPNREALQAEFAATIAHRTHGAAQVAHLITPLLESTP